MELHIMADTEGVERATSVALGQWYPDMPPMLTDETTEEYTDRLTGADKTGRVPYGHRRNRQCALSWHDECSDPDGLRCKCSHHTQEQELYTDQGSRRG